MVAAAQASAEADGEEAIDDWVNARVEEPKDEEHVGEGVGHLPLQVVREEPVPETQQVVGRPADDEAEHDDHAHLQSPQPSSGDVVL